MKNVNIYGAGISGLTAAIILARKGYNVNVFEKESKIGNFLHGLPSIHMTPIHLEKVKEYIGIDVEPCFTELESFKGYLFSKKVIFNNKHLYVVERGPRKTSIDNYLLNQAKKEGININFSSPLSLENIDTIPDNSIIATGSYSDLLKILKIHHVKTKHFDFVFKTDRDNICLAYFDNHTNGYVYISSKNGICTGHISFSAFESEKYIDYFKNIVKETEGIELIKLNKIPDNFPRKINLFRKYNNKTFILAGAISGFIDPFFGFGVNAALVSGKIVSVAVESKNKP